MRVLITSPRAPVTLEWAKFFRRQGYVVDLSDSVSYPIAAGLCRSDSSVIYHKIAAPRSHFSQYQKDIIELIDLVDLVIPTCEDIFYLAQVDLSVQQRQKCFMPDANMLLALHHKEKLFHLLPADTAISFPKTKIITSAQAIDQEQLEKTILKPVYSRFGASVIRSPEACELNSLNISKSHPWIQQEKVIGQDLASFAICQKGVVVCQTLYKPQYCLNGSASTYFEAISDERIFNFITNFVQATHYHGQLAFDFIESKDGIYVIECNPRATSGLHLLADGLTLSEGCFHYLPEWSSTCRSSGLFLLFQFGLKSLFSGHWRSLWRDYKKSQSIFQGLSLFSLLRSFLEMLILAVKQGISLTQASTLDIEYNGEEI